LEKPVVKGVHDIFDQGPQAVIDWFAKQTLERCVDDSDLLLLSQLCWTEAGTLFETDRGIAKKWAEASAVGYRFLSRYAASNVARSATEDLSVLLASKYLVPPAPREV
jgi:hypothetical protein